MGAPLATNRCPVCGDPNTCGLTEGLGECWCFRLTIGEQALARIPNVAKDRACLCPRCAAHEARSEPPVE